MEPWQSWTVVLFAGGALAYYYTKGNAKSKNRVTPQPHAVKDSSASKRNRRREDTKAGEKSAPGADVASSDGGKTAEHNKQRKAPKKKAAPVPAAAAAPVVNKYEKDDIDEDKEWAQRLAGNKSGTSLAPPQRAEGRQRTVKQGVAAAAPDLSANSSTTGAEADDDLSPVVSPALGAAPSGRDVSDMLEAATPGPSVLRLTEPVNPVQSKKQQKSTPAPVQESKKQRQNRKKNEERKLQREEDERQRRVALENQLRTAREARGEPAKNGLSAAKAPTSNAWTTVSANKKSSEPAPAVTEAPLLDTYDQDSNTSGSNAPASGASATTTSTNYGELPSEEEQTQWAMQDSGWSTVATGRRGRKKTATSADGTESSDTGIAQPVSKKAENVKSVAPIERTPAPKVDLSSGPSIFDASNDQLAASDELAGWTVA